MAQGCTNPATLPNFQGLVHARWEWASGAVFWQRSRACCKLAKMDQSIISGGGGEESFFGFLQRIFWSNGQNQRLSTVYWTWIWSVMFQDPDSVQPIQTNVQLSLCFLPFRPWSLLLRLASRGTCLLQPQPIGIRTSISVPSKWIMFRDCAKMLAWLRLPSQLTHSPELHRVISCFRMCSGPTMCCAAHKNKDQPLAGRARV